MFGLLDRLLDPEDELGYYNGEKLFREVEDQLPYEEGFFESEEYENWRKSRFGSLDPVRSLDEVYRDYQLSQ